uniref:Uncharacterized protein n=1 Tax=Promethearchaeum syntrophicum TaxID=2594042 RepID=A0A5B9DGI5_9ARCH|nr:hypothetical protein [Candidatus Prometheoarchaeum syntrophicum]QEE17777.1 hypothetical protein DSAG12_03615 [Candidatus Prometheoarchaeum syntrophicum]
MFKNASSGTRNLNSLLLDTKKPNPFPSPPIRSDFFNSQPDFIFGRDYEISEILKIIRRSAINPDPNLIEITGKQGIGKTTLTCWIFKMLEKSNEINKYPMIFLDTISHAEDFGVKALYKQIIVGMQKENLLNNLIFSSISQFFAVLKKVGGSHFNNLQKRFSHNDIAMFISNSENIKIKYEKDPKTIDFCCEVLESEFLFIQKLNFFNFQFMYTLWNSISPTHGLSADPALKGSGSFQNYHIESNNDALTALKDIIGLYRWINNNDACLVIVIDHMEACINYEKKKNFHSLFSLLLSMRQLENITIILSGTLDGFDAMTQILEGDSIKQIDNWASLFQLDSLSNENVVDIIQRYLSNYWRSSNYLPTNELMLYPFCKKSISYLYDATQKDLREVLKDFYIKIETYRISQRVQPILTYFDAFKHLRKRQDVVLTELEQRNLTDMLFDPKIQDKNRSTFVEMGIYEFFLILMNSKKYSYISDVKHEPPIGKHGEKPDIFVEFFGGDILKSTKKIAFEVKIFRVSNEIPKKDIKKTHVLLQDKKVDYVWWITNKPLSIEKYSLPENLKQHLGNTKALTRSELAYACYTVYFKDLHGYVPSLEEVETIFSKMGLNLEELYKVVDDIEPLSIRSTLEIPVKKPQEILDKWEKEIKSKETNKVPITTTKISNKIVEKTREELESILLEIINLKSNGTSMRITTFFKEIPQKYKIEIESEEDKERIRRYASEVAKKQGYRVTAASIMFNKL